MPLYKNLSQILAEKIKSKGPISVAEYMSQSLGHPDFGYYTNNNPFGLAGDFTTAPEISQMFGELIGLWCANTWVSLGKPNPFIIAELGPGRGTLMADALRALETVPECRQALNVHLVEFSPNLRIQQAKALAHINVTWHQTIYSLPHHPTIFIANEFFDALPIDQFVQHNNNWYKRLICLDSNSSESEPEFIFTLSSNPQPKDLFPPSLREFNKNGTITEISLESCKIVEEIAARIDTNSGSALIIDYGYEDLSTANSLQAIYKQNYSSVLKNSGSSDLTAHVNFKLLVQSANIRDIKCWGTISQSVFLKRLGIEARACKLISSATPEQKKSILLACERLISDNQMGNLFKVLSIGDKTLGAPAGFIYQEANLD
jgi:NADH dehydrogenase [ubiquinone] 1 alpha subcomplex assembly factor 7